MRQNYPFSKLVDGPANTLIFPNLSSSNIAYNLIRSIAGVELIGPIIMGLKKPVHVLQLGSSVREIVDMVAIAVVDAQVK
jgi:malate dehydrogenase (oxaloacetate-decarboxylating)(NADP+)